MPHPFGCASCTVLAVCVLGFFSSLTVVALAIGVGIERAFGRTRKIFAVPLAQRQLRFELAGNLALVCVSTVSVSTALHFGVVRFGPLSLARHVATFWAPLVGIQAFYWTLSVPLWPQDRMLELSPLFCERTRARLDPNQLAAELRPINVPAEPLGTSAAAEQKLRTEPSSVTH